MAIPHLLGEGRRDLGVRLKLEGHHPCNLLVEEHVDKGALAHTRLAWWQEVGGSPSRGMTRQALPGCTTLSSPRRRIVSCFFPDSFSSSSREMRSSRSYTHGDRPMHVGTMEHRNYHSTILIYRQGLEPNPWGRLLLFFFLLLFLSLLLFDLLFVDLLD